MIRLIRIAMRLRRLMRRHARDQRGNATIEFCLLFPIFITLLVSAIESGIMTVRYVMLDRAVDLQVRDLRLGLALNVTHDELKQRICDAAAFIPDCTDVMILELVTVDTDAWDVPSPTANCFDRTGDIEPVINFTQGAQNEMMIVRACVIIDPIVPNYGLGAQLPVDASGGIALVSSSAFVNEPN